MNTRQQQQILASMPDSQRRTIAAIMNGEIVKTITCLGKKHGASGQVMGHIYKDGKFRAVTDNKGRMWCRASRVRLDGNLGFECWCGNDSRLCEAEKGVKGIENNAVQKSDLDTVFARLQQKPANYPVTDGAQVVDGFKIEGVA